MDLWLCSGPFYLSHCRNLDNATVAMAIMTSPYTNSVQRVEPLFGAVCLAVFKSSTFTFSIALLSSVLDRCSPCSLSASNNINTSQHFTIHKPKQHSDIKNLRRPTCNSATPIKLRSAHHRTDSFGRPCVYAKLEQEQTEQCNPWPP